MKHLTHIILLITILLVSCKQLNYYNVNTTVQPVEGGSIAMTPSSNPVLEGSQVSFKATPNGDYVFTGWSGSLSGTENPKAVTVTADMSVTANFVLRDYPLTLSVEGEGSIDEIVISTKTDYSSGTVVELTAVPAAGWSFDHWEGDSSGSENPVQITVSSVKSIKAVFTKNHYTYNLTIIGPGVVDEYLVEGTKASLEYGTKVLLKAYPADGAVFKGWGGDLSGTEMEVVVDIERAKEITASFVPIMWEYPTPDLMQPSVKLKCLYYGVDFTPFSSHPCGYHPFDYNQDGIVDVIENNQDFQGGGGHRLFRFYTGNSDGSFSVDEKNDNRIMGNTVRKTISGDYNGDGKPDFFSIGHGLDQPPFPGDYPIALMSNEDGTYTSFEFLDYVSFYHGGSSADYDNDGDLDVFLIDAGRGDAIFFINDGKGEFTITRDLVNQELMCAMFTTELYDIDSDGYIDLVVGLDDSNNSSFDEGKYNNTSIVFWGNGKTFKHENYIRLPASPVLGMGTVLDYDFYDIDNDGDEELFLARTGDPVFGKSYKGWSIQVLKRDGRSFSDITADVVELGKSFSHEEKSTTWIDFEDIEDRTFLVGVGEVNARLLFEVQNGRLIKVEENTLEKNKPSHGMSIMNGTIEFSNWTQGDGRSFPFNEMMENGADLSYLKDNGYSIEFQIKNDDPSLRLDIKFDSIIDREEWKAATFFYGFDASSHLSDGSWETVVVPLTEFEEWSDNAKNYWMKVHYLHFQISSTGGKPFYVKDIRIRKVLPE